MVKSDKIIKIDSYKSIFELKKLQKEIELFSINLEEKKGKMK